MGWFLYDRGIRHERIKVFSNLKFTNQNNKNNDTNTMMETNLTDINEKWKKPTVGTTNHVK